MSDAASPWAAGAAARPASRSLLTLLGRALREPRVAGREGRAILKGLWCRAWCRLRGIRFEAGRNLRIDGRLIFRGPGRVIFGDNVRVGMTVTPWTYAADAVISIGSDSFVNGTSFACCREIRIGRRAILGRSSIMDTDFHSLGADRHDPTAPVRVAPVLLEDNVWVAAQAGVLPGTRIGQNSVVGFGAVCAGVYPENSVIAGNPARVIKKLPEGGSA
jgi:carbonic anhydrase/acetyltransferase-like protein (isoleucine patch superfamily)